MSEREVYRLSNDLRNGNTQDAVNVIRNELQQNPQMALQEIRQANAQAGQNARIHIGTRQDGDMAIVDQSGQPIARIGNVNQLNQNQTVFNPNYNGRQSQLDQYGRQSQLDQYGRQNQLDQYGRQNQLDQYGRPRQGFNNERQEIPRLAQDLVQGNTQDAARVMQHILHSGHGRQDIAREIQEANRLADLQARQYGGQYGQYGAREHIGTRRDGDVAIIDQNGRPIARIGNLNDCDNGYGLNQQGFRSVQPGFRTPLNYAPSSTNFTSSYYGDGQQSYIQPQQQQFYPQQQYGNNYNNNNGNAALNFGLGALTGAAVTSMIRGGGRRHH